MSIYSVLFPSGRKNTFDCSRKCSAAYMHTNYMSAFTLVTNECISSYLLVSSKRSQVVNRFFVLGHSLSCRDTDSFFAISRTRWPSLAMPWRISLCPRWSLLDISIYSHFVSRMRRNLKVAWTWRVIELFGQCPARDYFLMAITWDGIWWVACMERV